MVFGNGYFNIKNEKHEGTDKFYLFKSYFSVFVFFTISKGILTDTPDLVRSSKLGYIRFVNESQFRFSICVHPASDKAKALGYAI